MHIHIYTHLYKCINALFGGRNNSTKGGDVVRVLMLVEKENEWKKKNGKKAKDKNT